MMATIHPSWSEASPTLEEIFSRHGLKEIDLNRECPRDIKNDIAIELGADWEMIGLYLDFSLDELGDIHQQHSSQDVCRVALLDVWGKRKGEGATFSKLAQAFHRRKRRDLVDLLCTKLKSTLALVPLSGSLEMSAGNDEQLQAQQCQNDSNATVFPLDVSKRIKTLEEQFDLLHDRLVTELSEGGTSVEQVLQALTKLPLTFRKEYESTIQSMLPELEKREIIHNLFYRLNPLFTFIDYELLHHLVSKFGSQELKREMTSYETKVQLFKKVTTISEVIDFWPGLEVPQIDHKLLRAKFEDDPKLYTLEKLDYFRNHFYSRLRLSQFVSVSILMLLEPANSFIAMWFVPTVVVKELFEAFSEVDTTFLQGEQILELSLDERILYQRSVAAECMRSSVIGPLSKFTHAESPLQQADDRKAALYSFVISIKSTPPVHEVYIDAHLHYTALKILRSRRKCEVHGINADYGLKKFKFATTGSSEPSLRLIVPEKNSNITAVEPEDGMIRASDIWRESQYEDLQHHLEDYHLKITMRGREFDPPPIKFEGITDNSWLKIRLRIDSDGYMSLKNDQTKRVLSATDDLVLNRDIQFGYHSASGKYIRITSDGLGAERMDPDRNVKNGVAYGAQPLKGRAEFEVKIVSYGAEWDTSLQLQFGVMRCKKGVPIEPISIPSDSEHAVNHFVWVDQRLCNNLVTPSEEVDYGYVDLNDLREGDCVGLRLSKDGVLEFTVNGKSQDVAETNIYNRYIDVYAVVDHYGNCVATVINKAVTEYGNISLEELCVERISSWLNSVSEVDRLPLPTRLKDKLKWYLDK